jgi:spore coat polysaccharide biosynthesis protein SpsF (cytidylyltransferase family)
MKDYIIIQARVGSKRFPNKILKKINNKTILETVINRLKKTVLKNNIIVATSKLKRDNEIQKLCDKNKIKCFKGSELDLVKRYYECVNKYKILNIIRITSDCPFVDPKLINKFYKFYKKNNYDYVSNTTPPKISTYPDGSDVEIFSKRILFMTNKKCKKKFEREHLTNFMWKKNIYKTYTFTTKKNNSNFRYSLDYETDLKAINYIFQLLKKKNKFGYINEVIDIIKKNKSIYSTFKRNKKKYLENRKDLL